MTIDLHLGSTWPVLAPALAALLVLALDAIHPVTRPVLPWLAGLGFVGGAAGAVPGLTLSAGERRSAFCLADGHCSYAVGSFTSALQLLALGAALVVLVLGWPRWSDRTGEAPGPGGPVLTVLLLTATAGVVAVPAAGDFGTLLVALELATLPTVGLVALERHTAREAGAVGGAVALLTTSLLSFALLALGAAMWVAATGSAWLGPAAPGGATAGVSPAHRGTLLVLASVLALAGLGFKLSAVPFHAWTPVTYVRAPLPVTVYLAGASKVAALGGIVVVVLALAGTQQHTLLAVGVAAALSMTVGNAMALQQTNVVRLLAWSAVAQAGWVLLPLASASSRSARASVSYLVVYVVATLLAFVVVAVVAGFPGRGVLLEHHRGLARRHPLISASLGLALLTLTGLPPAIVGLVAKVVALRPVAGDGTWWLAVVAALNVALGIAVYLRWLVVLIERAPEDDYGRPVQGEEQEGAPYRPHWRPVVLIVVLSALLVAGSIAPVGLA